jgi:hypothetical protein
VFSAELKGAQIPYHNQRSVLKALAREPASSPYGREFARDLGIANEVEFLGVCSKKDGFPRSNFTHLFSRESITAIGSESCHIDRRHFMAAALRHNLEP